jgi:hypothetical protein
MTLSLSLWVSVSYVSEERSALQVEPDLLALRGCRRWKHYVHSKRRNFDPTTVSHFKTFLILVSRILSSLPHILRFVFCSFTYFYFLHFAVFSSCFPFCLFFYPNFVFVLFYLLLQFPVSSRLFHFTLFSKDST